VKLKEAAEKIFCFPFHPLLVAVFPVLSLYAHNIYELLPASLVRPLTVSVLMTLVVAGVLLLAFRNFRKAAILTSVLLIWFFSYGHLHGWLAGRIVESQKFSIGDGLFLTLFFSVAVTTLALRRTKNKLDRVTRFLNVASLALVLVALGNILRFELFTEEAARREPSAITTSLPEGAIKPDIYYLIFDRYAGQKVLSDFYNFDNKSFLDFLQETGFYVASESTANYPMTLLSLTSSLNLDYLPALFEQFPSRSVETPAYPLLENSAVLTLLKGLGYKYYHVGSWYNPTRLNRNADKNFNFMSLAYRNLDFDSFMRELYQQTILPPIFRKLSQVGLKGVPLDIKGIKSIPDNLADLHFNSAKYQFATLKEISSLEGPKFVFAHILLPHPPMVFGKDCEELSAETGTSLEAYLNQLVCTNKFAAEVVEGILSKSRDSIIILQSDEGTNPPLKFPYEGLSDTYGYGFEGAPSGTLKERFGILNAIYLPGVDASAELYPTITPVNTFRIIFNRFFGTALPLLPDKNFASWDYLWDFHEVTSIIRK